MIYHKKEIESLRIDYCGSEFDHINIEDIVSISIEFVGTEMEVTVKTKTDKTDYIEFEGDVQDGIWTQVFMDVESLAIETGFSM